MEEKPLPENQLDSNDPWKILEENRSFLQECRQAALRILKDPKVNQWLQIKLEQYENIFKFFGISLADVKQACSRYPEEAKHLLRLLEHCENEIGNQKAELDGDLSPVKRQAIIVKIKSRCAEINGPLAVLVQHGRLLTDVDTLIREKLTFAALLPFAKEAIGHRSKLFDSGYQVFGLVTDDPVEKDKRRNLTVDFSRATGLETALLALQVPELPAMATSMVHDNIRIVLEATKQVKNYIMLSLDEVSSDLKNIEEVKRKLAELRQTGLAAIMENMNDLVIGLGNDVINFHFKVHILEGAKLVALVLEQIKRFYATLKDELLEDMSVRIRSDGSPLNPATLARTNTEVFFRGMTGLIRMVRLLLGSFGGKGAISESELNEKLENILRTCPIHACNRPEEIVKIEQLIEQRLAGYDKPFPYDQLFQLFKNSLQSYAFSLRQYFNGFKVVNPQEGGTGLISSLSKGSMTIGKLVRRLELRAENFKKARPESGQENE